jgi:CheY-like chemotaxis protein
MSFFKAFFKKKDHKEVEIDIRDFIPLRKHVELFLPEERLISKFDPSKRTILIIDDSKGIVSIVEDYISEEINIDEYNVLSFSGVYAPFVMKETLIKLQEMGLLTTIDYAVIDIVLPGRISEGSQSIRMDGIDVSILLNEYFGCEKFVFYSGNVLNVYVEFIEDKITKFKNYFGRSMKNFMIIKTETEEKTREKFKKLFENKYVAKKKEK